MECSHTGNNRIKEYCPYHIYSRITGRVEGTAQQTMDRLISVVKPYIEKNYRTWAHREATAIGGSSMGGMISLYAILRYNYWFSKAACVSPAVGFAMRYLYAMWEKQEEVLLSERDYMSLAYELALRLPKQYDAIYEAQLDRISNTDRRQEFQYIFPSVSPSAEVRDSVFQSLSSADNRRIEPWTLKVLFNLNHPIRSNESLKYIQPALELLPDVQRTGDIFFLGNWCQQLLAGHRSPEAYQEVETFLSEHEEYPQLLTSKILLAKYGLERYVNNKLHN